MVNRDIKILMEFMGHLGPEVGGRTVTEADDETNQLLRRFARGECTDKEREDACKLMQEQPQLVRMVASELKGATQTERRRSRATGA